MPSATSPPRSILKPTSVASKDTLAPSDLSREDRNRQLALHHAHRIQYRKDIESLIHMSIETLLELPTSANISPSQPSCADRRTVEEALKPFQPSDYDSLIEERNINHKCGYVLCSRENRKQNTRSRYRIVTGRDFRVIESKELERWCSDECGRMALYLRVQLSEEPAWTREWEACEALETYNQSEPESNVLEHGSSESQFPLKLDGLDAKQTLTIRMKDLAVERGEKGDTVKASARVAVDVKENISTEQITPVPPCTESTHADSIEGYIPIGQHLLERTTGQQDDANDLMQTI
ncbi:MAG: hypothetical protein Q9171_005385 [Xanthocarpia ochracea]